MRNIKLLLEYEGTAYVGWQRQAQPNSIQQALEEAIARITGAHVSITGASRTDAGVHARGQVANFMTSSSLSIEKLRDALNAVLPPDIGVLEAAEAAEDFNARFAAKSKAYEYTIWNRPTRPVLSRLFCWHVHKPLGVEKMSAAARLLLGTHDFACFASANTDRVTSVRTMTEAGVSEKEGIITVSLEGNGFLYNMVRAVTGTLVEVGRGKLSIEGFGEILASRDRARAGRTAPARGLCLVRVEY